jgi:type IV pilus biogenesis protein PilP
MRNKWSALLACCALFGLSAAHAGSTADDLAQIEAENLIAKARLRLVETQAQIALRQADIERQAPLIQAGVPTVVGIEGMVGKLWATLNLDNGSVAEVRAGDALPNGMRVVSIAPEGVVVQTADKKRVRLKPAGEMPATAAASMTRSQVAAPSPSYGDRSISAAAQSLPPMQSLQSAPLPPVPRAPVTLGSAR